jgi:hypothetical protein
MREEWLTDEQVEAEIERLKESEYVKLDKLSQRIKNRRRQYMYSLRSMEKRGKELAAAGVTMESLKAEAQEMEAEA